MTTYLVLTAIYIKREEKDESSDLDEAMFWPCWDCVRGLWEEIKIAVSLVFLIVVPMALLEMVIRGTIDRES